MGSRAPSRDQLVADRRGNGRSAMRSPCRWPSSRRPSRNSMPPKRCVLSVTSRAHEQLVPHGLGQCRCVHGATLRPPPPRAPSAIGPRTTRRRANSAVRRQDPSRTAYSAACVRSDSPSLARMLPTCVLTVFSATPSSKRDRLVRAAAGDEREHLALARGQRSWRSAAAAVRAQLAQHARGDRRVQQRVAAVDGADRADELGRLDVLEQVARRARAHGGQHLVLVEEARQHDHARRPSRSRAAPRSRRPRRAAA